MGDVTITDTYTTIDVRPLSGVIGAEIRGVDLHQAIDDAAVAEIRAALLRHKVVFIPDQHLSPAEHVAFGRRFGDLTPAHPVMPGLAGFPEVYEIDYGATRKAIAAYGRGDGEGGGGGLDWHSDVTFVKRPPLGSILNAVLIPASGGDTMYSNQVAAFAALSPAMRDFLGTLTAVHDGRAAFGRALEKRGTGFEWEGETFTSLDPVEHPVVRTHPETGEQSLFVNPGFTRRIVQLSRTESENLLAFLYAHSTHARFTVRYHWRTGDLGFWDNRATQHAVVGDYGDQDRVIQRITLRGDEPRP